MIDHEPDDFMGRIRTSLRAAASADSRDQRVSFAEPSAGTETSGGNADFLGAQVTIDEMRHASFALLACPYGGSLERRAAITRHLRGAPLWLVLAHRRGHEVGADARDQFKRARAFLARESTRTRVGNLLARCRLTEVEEELEVRVQAGAPVPTADGLEDVPAQRVAARKVLMPTGQILQVNGRALPQRWTADPQTMGTRMQGCGAGSHLVCIAGKLLDVPHRCDCAVCPLCLEYRSTSRIKEVGPLLEGLAALGYLILSVTLTQGQLPDGDRPVILTEREAGQFKARRAQVGWAVSGEELVAGMARLSGQFSFFNSNRAASRFMRKWVLGGLYGTEATGRVKAKVGRWRLRWHVHRHLLLVLPASARVMIGLVPDPEDVNKERIAGPWWDEFLGYWEQATGKDQTNGIPMASRAAQCGRLVSQGGSEQVRQAVREVLKYPYKVSTLTDAQLVETAVGLKGMKPRHSMGVFHGTSHANKLWKALAVARPEEWGQVEQRFLHIPAEQRMVARDLARLSPAIEPAGPSKVPFITLTLDDRYRIPGESRAYVVWSDEQAWVWLMRSTLINILDADPDTPFPIRWETMGALRDQEIVTARRLMNDLEVGTGIRTDSDE